VFDEFSITPGVRLENIYQSVEEKVNVDKEAAGTPLGNESEYDLVPLFGVGLEYEFPRSLVGYGNISQAYRPKIFTEAVPTGGTRGGEQRPRGRHQRPIRDRPAGATDVLVSF
jgi:outer membrane receptor protein involved in Fe transport